MTNINLQNEIVDFLKKNQDKFYYIHENDKKSYCLTASNIITILKSVSRRIDCSKIVFDKIMNPLTFPSSYTISYTVHFENCSRQERTYYCRLTLNDE